MCVSPNTVSGEVCVSQEAALAIERRAVSVKALREGEHDVGVLVDLASDVAEGDLSEGQRDGALPNPEGLSDGFIRGLLPDLGGVVLYAVGGEPGDAAV